MKFFAIACLFLSFSASASTGDVQTPPANQLTIDRIDYAGLGCPSGSVSVHHDGTSSFTLLFDNFAVATGQGVPSAEARKTCQINLGIHGPEGWSFAVEKVEYRGFAALAAGVTGVIKTLYYFSEAHLNARTEIDFTGPMNLDYKREAPLPIDTQIWSACESKSQININTLAMVSRSLQHGFLTSDSLDMKGRQKFFLRWRKC